MEEMEINQNFIEIQGLLSSVVKSTGQFTKIKYKGGNEMKINQVIKTIEEFLEAQQYINKRVINKTYSKEIEELVFFLVINLDFNDKTLLEIKEFAHLVTIIPTLSKCLLANIVVELGLVEPYCLAIHKLPTELSEELLGELLPCVAKISPEFSIKYSYLIIKNIIVKIGSVDPESYKMSDFIGKLENMVRELLLNFSTFTHQQLLGGELKKSSIYKLMGLAMVALLKLLQVSSPDYEPSMTTTIAIINTVSSIMKCVTVDVFCSWAETKHQGVALQTAVGEEAFRVIEKYHKYKPASELVQMMGVISKRPRTLAELIQHADTATIISKINDRKSEDRKKWFHALLNTNIFVNEEIMSCVESNSEFCSPDDVSHILNLFVDKKSEKSRVVVLKCVSHLDVDHLTLIETRFYYKHGLKNALGNSNILNELTEFLNKLRLEENNENTSKEIVFMLLQEPEVVLTTLYKESVKSDILFKCLKETFRLVEDLVEVEGLFLSCLLETLQEVKLDMRTLDGYRNLFNLICEKGSSYRKIVTTIFEVYTKRYIDELQLEDLRPMFILYRENIKTTVETDLKTFLKISLTILEKFRWTLFDFTNIKAELCQDALDAVVVIPDKTVLLEDFTCNHIINKYYMTPNVDQENDTEFFNFICPAFPYDHQAHAVSLLIKVLPLCLKNEWLRIANNLIQKCGEDPTLQFITDALVLICEVVMTQDPKKQQEMYNGLRFCLQNYGIIVKNMVFVGNDNLNKVLVRSVCKVLKNTPKDLEEQGLALISIMPETALKSLKEEKSFVLALAAMRGTIFAQTIAKKMLS